jgi:Na+/serine symporter
MENIMATNDKMPTEFLSVITEAIHKQTENIAKMHQKIFFYDIGLFVCVLMIVIASLMYST